ncbi:MAG: hypothetical protein KDK39_04815, partial [Leptospiraceae bacterium]|nr:hypothetical protein [Leptospiraceae bacterium]
YAEYRMMLPPGLEFEDWSARIRALVQGLRAAEEELMARGQEGQRRLVFSLHRAEHSLTQHYDWLRRLQASDVLVQQVLVGIDFCAVEEGHPPSAKVGFAERLLADNKQNPESALALLYHVGESFTDKSVESACRWVYEAAQMGAHRLGHCLAVGIPARFFWGSERQESAGERLATLQFLLEHRGALQARHSSFDWSAIQAEYDGLRSRLQPVSSSELRATSSPAQVSVTLRYDEQRCLQLAVLQDYILERLAGLAVVIESCPTSNLRIGGLQRPELHPLRRFLEAGIKVVLGSDDPGILDTSLATEFELIQGWPGIHAGHIAALQQTALQSTSARLAGRSMA